MNKLQKIRDKFYYNGESPDLHSYGVYRMGLTKQEIDNYLMARGNTLNITKLRKKFYDIAGCNTMAIAPTGEGLMYRHDVQRFADVLFLNKKTYFD